MSSSVSNIEFKLLYNSARCIFIIRIFFSNSIVYIIKNSYNGTFVRTTTRITFYYRDDSCIFLFNYLFTAGPRIPALCKELLHPQRKPNI